MQITPELLSQPIVAQWGVWLPAPAKINLFLHVVGRRPDGYHLLQTVFRFLDWGDRLRFGPRQDRLVQRVNDVPGVPAEQDLCVRAARLLAEAAEVRGLAVGGATIEVDKRLPMGGGLGGGSSDAATVLLTLNQLWQTGFSNDELQALGLQLGADVPVFVGGRSAFAEGVGEALQPLSLPPAWYAVVVPPVSVPTPVIFSAEELTRNSPRVKISDFAGLVAAHEFGRNDLQAVAVSRYPEVAEALAVLAQVASSESGLLAPPRMSGSGACVFAACGSAAVAQNVLSSALAKLPSGSSGFVAQGMDVHPLVAGS